MKSNRDIFELLKDKKDNSSKSHRKIAEYILEHYDKAAFLTAAKLGGCVGVSESTVVRFASDLGFDGYPALQHSLQEAAKNKLTALQRIDVLLQQLGDGGVLEKVLQNDIDHIAKTLEETTDHAFNAAVDSILSAKNIYIMGIRSSAALANFMAITSSLCFQMS